MHCVFDESFGYESYVDYLLNVPMYYVKRAGKHIDMTGIKFIDYMNGKGVTPEIGEPTIEDFEEHITAVFPQVRLKKYLEMRGADSGDMSTIIRLSELWWHVIYDPAYFRFLYHYVKTYDHFDVEYLFEQLPTAGLDARLDGYPIDYLISKFRFGLTDWDLGLDIIRYVF